MIRCSDLTPEAWTVKKKIAVADFGGLGIKCWKICLFFHVFFMLFVCMNVVILNC